ncbi:MAG: YkvA family protein [Chloroflexota bacterium]|nr:YkvA family protein [Chloroflexota bacterium]
MTRGAWLAAWKQRARQLKLEAHALYLAYRDPRVPWYARLYAAFVVGYILSPIDPIPDFIPLIGYLDELLLVPAFVALARRMIPAEVLAEHRETAQAATFGTRRHWIAASVVVAVWIGVAVAGAILVVRRF